MTTPALRTVSDARPPRAQRSAVSNGKRLHVKPVGDGAWSRRFRDVLAEIISDLGGAGRLSEGQRQLARRAATISLECEKLENTAVSGAEINLETYGQLTDRLGRVFARLGLKRQTKDANSLTLQEYLRQDADEAVEMAPGDEERTSDRAKGAVMAMDSAPHEPPCDGIDADTLARLAKGEAV